MPMTRQAWLKPWPRTIRLEALTLGLLLGLGLAHTLPPAQAQDSALMGDLHMAGSPPISAASSDSVRLIQVSGNNQTGQPGEALPAPLVVRVEDEFGTPVAGVEVTAEIIEGEGTLDGCLSNGDVNQSGVISPDDALLAFRHFLGIATPPLDACQQARANVLDPANTTITPADALCIFQSFLALPSCLDTRVSVTERGLAARILQVDAGSTVTVITDASGRASFRLRAGPSEGTIRVRVSTLDQQADFLAFVGIARLADIAVEANGDLVVVDTSPAAVVRVDPNTGVRILVSGLGRGSGPPFAGPLGIAIDAGDGSLVVVGDVTDIFGGNPSVVVRVDPGTGNRTIVSGIDPVTANPDAPPIGNGPLFERPQDIAVAADRILWVVDGADGLGLRAVVRVDPGIGDRTVVSGVNPDTGELRGSGPRFFFPRDIAVDEANGTLLVAGEFTIDSGNSFSAVVRVDPNTGDRVIITTNREGIVNTNLCPISGRFDGIAVEAAGTLVVLANSFGFGVSTVLRIDPSIPAPESNCTVVSQGPTMNTPAGIGDGEGFISPTGIAIEEAAGTLVVADALLNAVVRVTPEGNRTLVSRGTSFGEGRILIDPVPVAVEADGNVVVVDNHDVTVVRVHPDTGDRTVVSGCPALGCARSDRIGDSEPPFAIFFRDIAIVDGSLVGVGNVTTSGRFDPVFPAVMRVNLQTGTREVLSGCPAAGGQCVDGFFGSGPPLIVPRAIAVAADHLVVAQSGEGLQAVVRVEPATGNRTIVSGCVDRDCTAILGSGPSFANPNGIAVAADGYLVVDGGSTESNPVVARVDPTTGNRTIVSGIDPTTGELIGSGPRFSFPSAITVAIDGSLVVVSTLLDFTALVRVDRDSGDRTIVSSNPFARNLPVRAIAALTFWEAEGVFLLADRFNTLFRLTIDGEANLVGFMDRPSQGLAFSADEEVLYAISPDDGELRRINPTNALTVSALTITLTGAAVRGGHGLARHPRTGELWALLALDDPTRLELVTIDPTTGVATRIGNTNDLFAGLAFDAGGTLFGVTDDASAIPDKSLFTLNTSDATPTCVLALGGNDRGEAIAFNPVNELLYHAAGQFVPIFESIDLVQPPTCDTPATTMNIPLTFSGRGSGPSFVNPQRIAVEASGNLVVVDGMFGLQAVIRVNPATGDRTIVSR